MPTILLACTPALVFSVLFVRSYLREPRQFRNALYLLAALSSLLVAAIVLLRDLTWLILLVVVPVLLLPLVAVVLLIINGVVVTRREGRSVVNALPFMLATFILVLYVSFPILVSLGEPGWLMALGELFVLEGLWFSFTLVALLLYSWLYRHLPRKRTYDYIVIHGAGLVGTRPSPLLAGRLDKGIKLWHGQGERGVIVVSGGQGPDEVVSEAEAMHAYLVRQGVPRRSSSMRTARGIPWRTCGTPRSSWTGVRPAGRIAVPWSQATSMCSAVSSMPGGWASPRMVSAAERVGGTGPRPSYASSSPSRGSTAAPTSSSHACGASLPSCVCCRHATRAHNQRAPSGPRPGFLSLPTGECAPQPDDEHLHVRIEVGREEVGALF